MKALAFGAWAVVLIEAAHRNSLRKTYKWIKAGFGSFLCNIMAFASLSLIFAAITNNLFASCLIVFVIWFAISALSFFKYAARNEPAYFSDVLLVFKVMGVADSSNFVITRQLVISLAAGLAGLAALFVFRPRPCEWRGRVIMAVLSVIVLVLLAFQKKNDFSYNKKGLICGLYLNILLYFKKPEAKPPANPGVIRAIKEPDKKEGLIRPNVIAVLSESFFDITRIEGLKLSGEPLPFFKSMREKSLTGTLLVTPLGGGTCAVEAEFLTGAVGRHFNITKPFYFSAAEKPIPSLATLFKERGYETCGLHTFSKYFYKRDNALKNMGFDEFYGLEDLKNPEIDGYYVSDKELTNMIEERFKRKKGKAFIFGISMENHQPYKAGKYKDVPISVQNAGLGGKLTGAVEAYVNGLTHADRELKRLVDFIQKQEEPTVLLFFGDHLGALGPELDFYKKIGYISDDGLKNQDIVKLYSPDFFIWSNFKKFNGRHENIGANFLPKLLLDCVGGEKAGLFSSLDWLYDYVRCISREDVFIDSKSKIYNSLPDSLKKIEQQFMYEEFKAMNILKKDN